jgi:hypothetical protein
MLKNERLLAQCLECKNAQTRSAVVKVNRYGGRGTDIKLTAEVKQLVDLRLVQSVTIHVVLTEQGWSWVVRDPGSSQFMFLLKIT